MTLTAIATIRVDFDAAWAFLLTINPDATKDDTRWTFVFAPEGSTEIGKELDELKMPFSGFARLAGTKNQDGHGCFVAVKPEKFVRLPGTHIVRDLAHPVAVSLEDATTTVAAILAGKAGESLGVGTKTNLVSIATAPTLDPAHRALLNGRGVTDDTLLDVKILSITSKKSICEQLQRTSWDGGSVCAYPHFFEATPLPATYRFVPERPVGGNQSKGLTALWTHGPYGVPYLPLPALENNTYATATTIYWVFDEIDALVLHQRDLAVVGAENISALLDPLHEQETGTERLHPAVTNAVGIDGRSHVVLYYSLHPGKKKHDAFKLVMHLKRLGAGRCSVIDVRAGTLRVQATDDDAWDALLATQTTPSADQVNVAFPTLDGVLGHGLPSTLVPLYIPKEFDVEPNGEIIRYKETMTANGILRTPERITRNPMFVQRIVEDFESKERSYEVAFQVGAEWRTTMAPVENLLRKSELSRFSSKGMHVSDHNVAGVVAWLHEFCELNDREKRFEVVPAFRRTGWHLNPDGTSFYAFPGLDNRTFDTASGREAIFAAYHASGSRDISLAILQDLMYASDVCNATILAGFAGPFIDLIPECTNLVVHLYGQTTSGKTVTMHGAGSIYGHPDNSAIKGNTTPTGLEYKLATQCGVATLVDELPASGERSREELAYMIYDGTGKTRGAKDGGTRKTLHWKCSVITTGEGPFTNDNARGGAQARILNLEWAPMAGVSEDRVNEMYAEMKRNYGHMILEWAPYISKLNVDDLLQEYRDTLQAMIIHCRTNGINVRAANNIATLMLTERHVYACFGIRRSPTYSVRELLAVEEGATALTMPDTTTVGERALNVLITHLFTHPGEMLSFADTEVRGTVTARRRPDGSVCVEPGRLEQLLSPHHISARMARREWHLKQWLVDSGKSRTDKLIRVGKQPHRFIVLKADLFLTDLAGGGHTSPDQAAGTHPATPKGLEA